MPLHPFSDEKAGLEWYRSLKNVDQIAFDAWLMRDDKRLLRPLFWRIFGAVLSRWRKKRVA